MTTDERIDALEKALETSVRRQRITITALILVAVAAVLVAVRIDDDRGVVAVAPDWLPLRGQPVQQLTN